MGTENETPAVDSAGVTMAGMLDSVTSNITTKRGGVGIDLDRFIAELKSERDYWPKRYQDSDPSCPPPELPTPDEILKIAKDAPTSKRGVYLLALAESLAYSDAFTVGEYARQASAAGLCNQADFRKSVTEACKILANLYPTEAAPGIPTDDELAETWRAMHSQTAYGLGEWRRYDRGIWPAVEADFIAREILAILESQKPHGIKPNARLLNSVTEIARLKVRVDDSLWDANCELLACRNGTLNIPTRNLQEHSPKNYLTAGLEIDYDPQADAPNWRRFLDSTVSKAVESFLQEFIGYCLTPDCKFEIATWLYGPPGGGKSTFITGPESVLRPRVTLLSLADIERSRFALTNLPGKTLAISTENPGMFLQATNLLNAIISGEPVTVDRKFRDPIKITPQAKLCFAMNELPRVADAGNGLFRRIQVVYFPEIPEANRDPDLKEKIKTEGAGILNWALDGLARLRDRNRFDIPSEIKSATAEFQEASDPEAAFVSEKCLTGEIYQVQASALYKAYRDWCAENGHRSKSSTGVAQDWKRLGFIWEHARTGSVWHGVGLKM